MAGITVSDFVKVRYSFMIYVGFVIAKLNHYASATSPNGTELIKPLKFTNNSNGFQLLDSLLPELAYLGDSSNIGFESATHCKDNFSRYLFDYNYSVCMSNSIKDSLIRKDNFCKLTITIIRQKPRSVIMLSSAVPTNFQEHFFTNT